MHKAIMMAATTALVMGGTLAASKHAHAAAWSRCMACHDMRGAHNRSGPGLGKGMLDGKMQPGVFGRVAGTHAEYHYQFTHYIPAGKAWRWDEAHLRQWMCNSYKAIRAFTGNADAYTRMAPQHVCDRAQQDEVLAKLKAISGDQ